MKCALLLAWISAAGVHASELAVVIDDIGYSESRGLQAIDLPGPITIAVLPFAPHSPRLALTARARGVDVIVHLPMEPQPSDHARPERGTLTLQMSDAAFATSLTAALDAVPEPIGISNHAGSLLTAHRAPMLRLMAELNLRRLYFLDSCTTPNTVAYDAALEMGTPALRRDVFLDHDRSPQAIRRAFDGVLRRARVNGSAVLVAHPYPESLNFLRRELAALPEDITLVPAAELAFRHQATLALGSHPAFPHRSPGR